MVMPYLTETKTSAETIAEFKGYNHNPVTEQNEFYDMENMTGGRFPLIATRDKRGIVEDILFDGDIVEFAGWTQEHIDEIKEAVYSNFGGILCVYLKGDLRFTFWHSTLYGVYVAVKSKDGATRYAIGVSKYVAGKHYVVAMGAQLILFPEKVIVTIKEDYADTTKYNGTRSGEDWTGDYLESMEHSITGSHTCTLCYDLHGHSVLSFSGPSATAPEIKDTQYIKSTNDSGDDTYDVYSYSTSTGHAYSGTITANRITKLGGTPKQYGDSLDAVSEHWWYEATADGTYVLHRYDSRTGWVEYPTYIKISNMGGFKEGDAIKLSGSSYTPFNKYVKSYIIEKTTIESDVAYAYIKVALTRTPSTFPETYTSQNPLTAERKMPNLDHIIEVNNRLWGCRFGESIDGEYINEIFASKLGDPKNWYSFANTAEDSYYVSLPDAGKFTGAVNYQNNPVFFRENRLHRITGTYPGNFRMNTMVCNGVKEGNNDSLQVLNDICYYMSPYGMCAYNGGIPISLAEAFGDIDYTNVKCDSAATCNELYCLITGTDNDGVFVFDDSKAFWHRESGISLEQGDSARLCGNSKEVLAYRNTHTNAEYLSGKTSYDAEGDFNWFIQTAEMGYFSPYHKRLNKLVLKLRLSLSAKARIEIQYDRDGIWHHVNEIRPTGRYASYSVPVSPQRCDTFSLRISGKGSFSLIAITRFWVEGSDRE